MDEVFYQAGSSPHTRGAPVDLHLCVPPGRIIPAYAGSTAAPRHSSRASNNHPCIRGEHGAPWSMVTGARGSSPHTRGAPPGRPQTRPGLGIIPAYAGSTTPWRSMPEASRDHPRIRGEHIPPAKANRWEGGSSPHTRGARRSTRSLRRSSGSFPHTRGARRSTRSLRRSSGSFPHTRGAQWLSAVGVKPDGIIPAYAGSTAARGESRTTRSDHPRIRGEHRHKGEGAAFRTGSSPHTRGAREPAGLVRRERRIIPAYAGSTGRTAAWIVAPWDHPRIRGEHWSRREVFEQAKGSSPHTRGARNAPH